MGFEGRNVLLISPEPWGGVQVSKHALAHALVRRGCRVCFWGPPEEGAKGLTLKQDKGVDLVHYAHWFRGVNRFPRFVRDQYYGGLTRRIEQLAGLRFDTIWCFDTTRMQEFPRGDVHRILHLVDYDTLDTGDGLIRTAEVVLTVAEPISDHARKVKPDVHVECVGHVLDERWLEGDFPPPPPGPPRTAAYAGNLQTQYIDWEMFAAAVLQHPEIHFDLYGPYDNAFPDAGFQAILNAPNTTFHGLLSKADLIPRMRRADILFVCYRTYLLKDIVSNSHKVLEYLSTGNVIVSSHVLAYEGTSLFLMAHAREEFPALFTRACEAYDALNTPALREARVHYARERTMPGLLDHVGNLLKERP